MDVSDTQQRMKKLIKKYYMLNRVSVSDDTSRFVRELAQALSTKILSIPSGTHCFTWVIPQKWTVKKGYVETLVGKRVIDFARHPLYLKSYSAPFSGEVSHEELMKHITTDQTRPDCLIYDYRWQYQYGDKNEWGFSMPYTTVRALNEKRYRVHIDTKLEPGEMNILDWTLPGELREDIFFAAHTCHPGQVNDGIANIAVAVELFNWLQQKRLRYFTYRMILGPEYFAAAGLLQHGDNVDRLKYGFFLDMLGNGKMLGFSHSYRGNSYVDKVTRNVLKHYVESFIEKTYRGLWGNDEIFYDGPAYQIPTLCVGRDMFEHYHTDKDNIENCNFDQLEESLTVLKRIVDVFENDCIPIRNYKGPLYLSRFGLYTDPQKNLKGYQNLQEIQILMDGRRSCLEIADMLDIDYTFVRSFVDELCQRDLASIRRPNHRKRNKRIKL